ncbi:MAG: TerB family tellurite resistance protein [Gammaproteobacteria bacterium]|nr:TerB family tellurite resistance protein [Gammaproteobacteria bacterium]MBU1442419.1 TerB family tellurite resistance protein [Gammaproteobacteria bacterium]MBU2288262.1 TerB family tellurite resistance protein [Gammaproteobacteria bacterium]MBU2407494.1 TerB family tellurite resistance protein [Gammaproteobacteria bacterium]
MLKTLTDLWDAIRPPDPADTERESQHLLQLATAVLLVEIMRADTGLNDAKRSAVIAGLRNEFGLEDDELERLVELAQQTAKTANDYFTFTSRINDSFDMAHKVQVIEHMWRVAYADGALSARENHLMWKVSDLLYIPHGAYVHAKMRAQGREPGVPPSDQRGGAAGSA